MEVPEELKIALTEFDQKTELCDICFSEYLKLEQIARNASAYPSIPLLERKIRVAHLTEEEVKFWKNSSQNDEILGLAHYFKLEFPTIDTWLDYISVRGPSEPDLLQAFAQCGSNYKRGREIFDLLIQLYSQSDGDVVKIRKLYELMLTTPHEQLEESYQNYSQFVTERFPESYLSLMRDASRLKTKTESLSQYYIIHEKRISEDPSDPQPWIDYIESCAMHKQPNSSFSVIEEVFYRSLVEPSKISDEKWIPVWKAFLKQVQKHEPSRLRLFVKKSMRCLPSHPFGYLQYLDLDADEIEFPFLRVEFHRLLSLNASNYQTWKKIAVALLYGDFRHFTIINGGWREPYLEDISRIVSTAFEHEDGADVTFLAISLSKRCSAPQDEFYELFLELTTAAFDRWPKSTEVWVRCFNLLSLHAPPKFSKRMLELLPQDLGQLDNPHLALESAILLRALNGTPEELRMLLKLQDEYRKITPKRTASEVSEVVEEIKPLKRVRQVAEAEEPVRSREIYRVKVENLPASATHETIADFFKGYCEPLTIDLHSTQNGNLALVEFGSEQKVLKALVRDQKQIEGSPVSVKRVFGNTLWLSNYPLHWGPQDLESFLRKQNISYLSVRYPSQSDKREKRFCYIDFPDTESTQRAESELNLQEVDKFTLHAEISNPTLKKKRSGPDTTRQVYVHNLNFETTNEETLRELFSTIGKVEDINVPLSSANREKSLKNNGYAFVTFLEVEAVKKALALNNHVLDGRYIHVSRVKTKQALKQPNQFQDDRSIALFNVNTIVTQSYLQEFLNKQVGPTREILMKPSKKAALVEFEKLSDCGRAKLLLEGMLFEEEVLHVGTKADFFKESEPHPSKKPMMAPPMLMRKKRK